MILELDAGNTRIKWRLLGTGGVVREAGAVHSLEELSGGLRSLFCAPRAVRVVSVREARFRQELSDALQESVGLAPEYAAVTRQCGGLSTACTDLARLGVDRWLVALAAWHRDPGACVVIDCGSAVTLDLVDGAAVHRGGYIVPGLSMQLDALLERTGIRFLASPRWGEVVPGDVTETAVCNGIFSMILAWLQGDAAVRDASGSGRLYLTGGDADLLRPALERTGLSVNHVPDLVMEGLSYACPVNEVVP